jgi:hydrogenase nickel incorporation protein HypB
MFRAAEIMVLNKTDLLPLSAFDVARAIANAREVDPAIKVFQVSARRKRAGRLVWLAAQRNH